MLLLIFSDLTIREVTCQKNESTILRLAEHTTAGLFSFLLPSIVHTIRLLSNVCTAFDENSFINPVDVFCCASLRLIYQPKFFANICRLRLRLNDLAGLKWW